MNSINKLLEPYSTKTQQWIVSSGIELYERSKTIPQDIHLNESHPPKESTQHYQDEIARLRNQFDEMRIYYKQIIQDEYNRGRQEEQTRYQTIHEQLQQDIHSLQEELTQTRRENRENREIGYKEGQCYSEQKQQELISSLQFIKQERDTLNEKNQQLSQKLVSSRQEIAEQLHQHHQNELTRLRTEIEQEKQEKREILTMREQMIQHQTSLLQQQYTTQVNEMNKTIQTMESQIQRYQELYEATGKGIEYEKLVVSRMEDYNHQYLGNQWHIQHVGQLKGGGKGDIQLVHRELGVRVMIDLKNKNEVGKQDIQKFLKDVETTENQCDIGMLITRGRIFTKRLYHVEQPKDKLHMYISNFKTDQIGMLFTSLDMACEKWHNQHKDMNLDEYRKHLCSLFLFFRKQHDLSQREVDKMKTQMNEIGDKYYKCFHVNIELDMDANKKNKLHEPIQSQQPHEPSNKTSKPSKTSKPCLTVDTSQTNTDIDSTEQEEKEQKADHTEPTPFTSLEQLETTCQVIGKRSKYAIVYEKQGNKKLHYFRGDSVRQKKIQTLHQQGIQSTIIDR